MESSHERTRLRFTKNFSARLRPIVRLTPAMNRTFPNYSSARSKKNSTPRAMNNTPNDVSPMPIFCVSSVIFLNSI